MNKVYHHIGVPPAAVETSFKKGNENSLVEIVTNYDELVTALANQGMTHYLDTSLFDIKQPYIIRVKTILVNRRKGLFL